MAKVLRTGIDYTINPDNSISVATPTRRKMGGTDISKIVGMNPWSSGFQTATDMFNIYEADLSDNARINAGSVLEIPILDSVHKSGRLPLKKAEELFPDYQLGPRSQWKYHYEDEYFGGHLDAVAEDGAVVECKTTTDRSKFAFGHIPIYYWLQASLYAYLKGTDRIYFVVGYLTDEEVQNPYSFVPSERNVEIYETEIYPDLDIVLQQCREWYDRYIRNQITPVPNLNNDRDREIFDYLSVMKMSSDEINTIIGHYEYKMQERDRLKAELEQAEKEAEQYKVQLMTYMSEKDVPKLQSLNYRYTLSTVNKKIADTDRMKKDGIFDNYSKDSSYQTLRKSKV